MAMENSGSGGAGGGGEEEEERERGRARERWGVHGGTGSAVDWAGASTFGRREGEGVEDMVE